MPEIKAQLVSTSGELTLYASVLIRSKVDLGFRVNLVVDYYLGVLKGLNYLLGFFLGLSGN